MGEHIKYAPPIFKRALAATLAAIADRGAVPDHMHRGVGHMLPKKGADPLQVSQQRLIVAGCPFAKVLHHVLLQHLTPLIQATLGPEQAGFMPGRNCQEQVFALHEGLNAISRSALSGVSGGTPTRKVVDTARAATPLPAFLDFRKAFDTVSHSAVARALDTFAVPPPMAALIMDHVRGATVSIMTSHGLTAEIHATRGVPQGGVLSPALFNMCLHGVLAAAHASTTGGPSLEGRASSSVRLPALAYADDVVLFGSDVKELRATVANFAAAAADIGLHINAAKSGILVRSAPNPVKAPPGQGLHFVATKMRVTSNEVASKARKSLRDDPIMVDGQPLPVLTDYRYLGVRLASNHLEAQWDRSQADARRRVRGLSYSAAPLVSGNWMSKHHAVSLARGAAHGSLLYGAAAIGNTSLMSDIGADRSLGHALAWNTMGHKGSTWQPRLHQSAAAALGIAPTASLHVKARATFLWGVLKGPRDTPAFAVMMITIAHAAPLLPAQSDPGSQVAILLQMDCATSRDGAMPAWVPWFVRAASELRLLGMGALVTELVAFAHSWCSLAGSSREQAALQLPTLMPLGNKTPRPAQTPPPGNLPKTWSDLPQLINGETVATRCDSLTQLLWQASAYPHALYSAATTELRQSRSIHPYRHDARMRGMAWVQPVPTALNAAQWATQDNAAHARKTLFLQNGRLLLDGITEWADDAPVTCPLCTSELKAGEVAAHLMLDCEHLSSSRALTLDDIHKLMDGAPAPTAPDASARVAVPLPKQLVLCVQESTAATAIPQEHRTAIHRLLILAQWPAEDENVLSLKAHEAAALTWCGTPAVWVPRHADLDALPAKRKRSHSSLDSIRIHPVWQPICARCAAWCADVFDTLVATLLTQHAEDSDRHGDVTVISRCAEG